MKNQQFYSWGLTLLIIFSMLISVNLSHAEVVVISQDITIAPDDTSYDNDSVTVDGCTVTIEGAHQFESLSLVNSATVTHSANSTSQDHILDLTVTGDLTIDSSSSINVDGKGYSGSNGPGKAVSR